jgi:hypothetical protein
LLTLVNRDVESLPLTFRQVHFIDAVCPPRNFDDVIDSILAP